MDRIGNAPRLPTRWRLSRPSTTGSVGYEGCFLFAVDAALGFVGAILVLHSLEPSRPLAAVSEPLLHRHLIHGKRANEKENTIKTRRPSRTSTVRRPSRHVSLGELRR